jgi:cyanophycinase-like exopeptidase
MGEERYVQLKAMLSPDRTVVGIDESTALIVDPVGHICHVMGLGGVTIVDGDRERYFEHGTDFAASELGAFRLPDPQVGIPSEVWAHAQATLTKLQRQRAERATTTPHVQALVERRTAAREREDWAAADSLRKEIEAEGWEVRDTPQGPVLARR